MLVTDDEAIATRARVMSLHGISRDAWNRYAANGSWYYEIEDAGYKYNMTDIAAALGLVQLERADELLAARRELAAAYSARLGAAPFDDLVELPADAPDGSHAWHLYIVRLALDRLRDRPGRGHRGRSGSEASGRASTSSRSISTRTTGGAGATRRPTSRWLRRSTSA